MLLLHGGYGIFVFSPTFTHFHPFSHFFLLIFTMDSTLWCGPLSWGDELPRFGVNPRVDVMDCPFLPNHSRMPYAKPHPCR